MIRFNRFTLDNGLTVIVHQDKSTPMAAVNVLYDIGSRDEDPGRTGFAHLFEHLMFSGSVNIPNYDTPLERVGGENNAFTTNDITNYYLTLPAENLETAFWLESDRMLQLAFSEQNLEIQKNVVTEEYRERYLNRPYGDVWLLLKPLAYKVHPYQWDTIGKDISHIKNAGLNEVKNFFYRYYAPNNAILSVTGNVDINQVKELAQKWFGDIEERYVPDRDLPEEPPQTEPRNTVVERDVPADFLIKAYHTPGRLDQDFYASDLISDLLANGNSSRLYQNLVKKHKLFSNIDAFITGNIDKGLLVVGGSLVNGVTMDEAEGVLHHELERLVKEKVKKYELQKVKNKLSANLIYSYSSVDTKAMKLAYHELLGDAADINRQVSKYAAVSRDDIQEVATNILDEKNRSTLYYYANDGNSQK